LKSLIEKLDLAGYIKKFQSFLAREKPIAIRGDRDRHFRFIKALEKIEFKTPPALPNLDGVLNRVKKQAVLKIDEIYHFVQIMEYFNYLKTIEAKEPLGSWFRDIDIPEDMREVINFFAEDGKINLQNSPELFEIEEAIKRNKLEIKEAMQRVLNSSKMAQFIVDKQVRFYDGEDALLVRGGFLQVVDADIIGRSEGHFFYIVPKSVDKIKSKGRKLNLQKEEIIYSYQKQFSAIFHKWVRFLEFINREFDRFDHYQARVLFARSFNYQFLLPTKGSRNITLSEFAHPAIEKPVLIDISFNKPIMLITGVNAGGKTMLLKSILSAVFMSKYILPFKCNSSKSFVGEFRRIEAIIDDPQSVSNDISTFAGRMVEFSRLFREKGAIVGVDEIELGTDSDEAASLFRVFLDELKKRDITFVVTTHHKRLASLMAGDRDVELIAALYDEKNRLPTYTFLQGSIGKSYAFETAKRYGIPEPVVERAKEFFGEDKERLNELIEKSTTLESEMREKKEELSREIEKLKRREEMILEQKKRLDEEHKRAIFKLESSYYSAKSKVLEALKEVESAKARQLLNQAHQSKPKKAGKSESSKKYEFRVGDSVKYRKKSATVLSLKSKKALILLDDGIKVMVSLGELSPNTLKIKKKTPNNSVRVNVQKPSQGSLSLKLLGKRVDEALDEVDDFLSNALLHNFSEVEIIHGTGTGALSKAVTDYLKSHPKVKSFGKMKGNMGVTVVNL
jgi:DNA mismatch repair protein MutS2